MAQDEKVSIASLPTSLLCDIVLPAANAWFTATELGALGEIIRRAKAVEVPVQQVSQGAPP